jgi:protein gp37
MKAETKIEYATRTWNVVTGCTHVSAGCDHCFAKRLLTTRLKHIYPTQFSPTFHEHKLNEPEKWRKPQIVFVASMGDVFHPAFTIPLVDSIFDIMLENPQHIYLVLTKRPDRMDSFIKMWKTIYKRTFQKRFGHIWFGVSCEDQQTTLERVSILTRIDDINRYLSIEPLLDKISLMPFIHFYPHEENRLHWVIVGGESGSKARPMHPDWGLNLSYELGAADIPFYFKQWGNWRTVSPLVNTMFLPGIDENSKGTIVDHQRFEFQKYAVCASDQNYAYLLQRMSKNAAGHTLIEGENTREIPDQILAHLENKQ